MMPTESLAMFKARRLARRIAAATATAPPSVAVQAIPIAGPVAVESGTVASGDGRRIDPGALTADADPIPILWDRDDGDHTGMVVGHYQPDTLTRRDDGAVLMEGQLGPTSDPDVAAAIGRIVELLTDGVLGQSVSLDTMTGHLEASATRTDDDAEWSHDDQVEVVTAGRIRHVALVDTPAFPEARPVLAAVGRTYPAAHFAEWQTDGPVPFTIDDDGRVWGHAAGTGCHRSSGTGCLVYTSDVDPTMAGFHTGSPIPLDDGTTVRPGPVTFGGLHADTSMSRDQRRAHHEAGSTVVALVKAFEDHKGRLAVAGTLVDGLDPGTVDRLRGCAPSYERWPEGPGLTLLGLHMVPAPAHPVATAAAAGGPQVGVDCMCTDARCEVCGG